MQERPIWHRSRRRGGGKEHAKQLASLNLSDCCDDRIFRRETGQDDHRCRL